MFGYDLVILHNSLDFNNYEFLSRTEGYSALTHHVSAEDEEWWEYTLTTESIYNFLSDAYNN